MDSNLIERLDLEISLLESMYPNQIHWASKSRELSYTTDESKQSTFTLRLPDSYLATSLPSVLLANIHKSDARDGLQQALNETCQPGEECLDAIISIFNELASSQPESEPQSTSSNGKSKPTSLTVIIWLHHLLAQSKRKLALHPSSPTQPTERPISGLTKPGYPGVLVFSGPTPAVKEHVAELKGQKWQAFQVRLEEEGEEVWKFEHGEGIREVETMGEVVRAVVGEERRETLCGVLGIK